MVIVRPRIINMNPDSDESDPQDDVLLGHSVRSADGSSLFYGQTDEVQTWLQERGYAQVSRSGMYAIDGRYERK